jgi:hypothetical protein
VGSLGSYFPKKGVHPALPAASNGFRLTQTGKGADALELRPQLSSALNTARKRKCSIAVAKLDRLSRDVRFDEKQVGAVYNPKFGRGSGRVPPIGPRAENDAYLDRRPDITTYRALPMSGPPYALLRAGHPRLG